MRVKDIDSCTTGLMKGLIFPNDEFDVDYRLIFTNHNRKEYQQQKSLYKIIQKSQCFDFLDDQKHFYETTWRIVIFKLEDSYEIIVTNLSRNEFDSSEIKYLYNLRWKTETAYRYLKHDINLTHFISRKKPLSIKKSG
ncbi:MAG: transposase [Erysipelotrichaceae bacterium]|nr:transposase [Erysipelotrichaceae bacterium]